jgi:hypothetical protein
MIRKGNKFFKEPKIRFEEGVQFVITGRSNHSGFFQETSCDDWQDAIENAKVIMDNLMCSICAEEHEGELVANVSIRTGVKRVPVKEKES